MIVSRGLGKGGLGTLVAAGLAIAFTVIVVPPTPEPPYVPSGSYSPAKVIPLKKSATITLPAIPARELLASIEAKGHALVGLYVPEGLSSEPAFIASGAAKAKVIGVSSTTKVGKIIAEGVQDLSDEEIVAMILAILDEQTV